MLKRVDLLKLDIASHFDVGPIPELAQVRVLTRRQALEPQAARAFKRTIGPLRAAHRPGRAVNLVRQQLRQPYRLPGDAVDGDEHAAALVRRLVLELVRAVGLDVMVHAAGQRHSAGPRHRRQDDLAAGSLQALRKQHSLCEGSASSLVTFDRPGLFLIHQLRRDHDGRVGVEQRDLVGHGGDMPVLERNQPPGSNSNPFARALFPGHVAFEDPGPHVERALVLHQRGLREVERFVVHVEPNQRAVRSVDDGLSGPRITVGGLRIDDRPGLMERR